jgi:hypothetical protein
VSGVGIKRKHLGEKAWREILSRLEASGLGATTFCQREGLAVASLKRWRERLSRPPAPAPTPSRLAAAVDVTAPPSASSSPPAASPPPPSPQPRPQTPSTPKFIELGTLGQASVGTGRLEIKLDLGGGLSLHLVRG